VRLDVSGGVKYIAGLPRTCMLWLVGAAAGNCGGKGISPMDNRFSIGLMALSLGLAHQSFAASRLEKIRNAKVVVTEETLAPGERETAP